METFPRYWPFVQGIHRSPVNSPHKGQCNKRLSKQLWGWWLGRHRSHYDITVMVILDKSSALLRNHRSMANIIGKGIKLANGFKISSLSTGVRPKRIARPAVETSGYYLPGEIISTTSSTGCHELEGTLLCEFYQTLINDNKDATCVNTTIDDRLLQVVFYFRHVSPGHQMSVEVVMKNVDGCSSPAWTWFVGSECRKNGYKECSLKQIEEHAGFIRCIVTCPCWGSCHYLHFVYNLIPWSRRSVGQLCEVGLV